ncbi:MAG TPA: hypothetical protein ENI81_09085 [Phycisphaerales bacterium]|nr:hypothetical protein [Phycisphaerales bacterium]
MKFFVDLDGVLVDTVGEMFRRFGRGKTPRDLKGSYDTRTALGLTCDPWSQFGGKFWSEAPWMEGSHDWFRHLAGAGGSENIYLCSSPTHEPDSAAGKLRWIQQHLPYYARRYVLTPCKELLAGPDCMLIDDCDDVVDAFVRAGGRAILVPRPWNSLHAFDGDVVAYMIERIDSAKVQALKGA